MKTVEARSSRSPLASESRGVQSSQMSSGIAAMRVSVIVLGRFTQRVAWLRVADRLIMLHVGGQGKGAK